MSDNYKIYEMTQQEHDEYYCEDARISDAAMHNLRQRAEPEGWNEIHDADGIVIWTQIHTEVNIGEWGYSEGDPRGTGHIVCDPECAPAVIAAYDAIEEGDLGPDVLDDVYASGGRFVQDDEE